MYDVNYDEFEPVESADGGTYSTATPGRKRHVGLAIGMSLLAVVLCGVITLVNLFYVRIERSGDSISVIITQRAADIAVSQVPETPPAGAVSEPVVELRRPQPETDAPLRELYRKLQPTVVTVAPDMSDPDNPASAGDSACMGIVMTDDGYIITCYYAIAKTGAVKVTLSDGTSYVAARMGFDPLTDLAVLKIDAQNLAHAEFADSELLDVGTPVLSLGLGEDARLGSVLTDGIICAMAKDLDINGRAISVLQTNACARNGGYGAPIVNMHGEVVGIRVNSIGSLRDKDDLALAVPMLSAKSVVDELIENGFIPGQPTLSFKSMPVTDVARTYYGLPPGAFVESVDPGGAADQAGVMPGDVITGIDDFVISSYEELDSVIKNNYKAEQTAILHIYRASLSRGVKDIFLEVTFDEIHN